MPQRSDPVRHRVPEPACRFFTCTAMMMAALAMPAAVEALLNIEPDFIQPESATAIVAFALSASIVISARLIARLVRGNAGSGD